jgi:hypothetical protein
MAARNADLRACLGGKAARRLAKDAAERDGCARAAVRSFGHQHRKNRRKMQREQTPREKWQTLKKWDWRGGGAGGAEARGPCEAVSSSFGRARPIFYFLEPCHSSKRKRIGGYRDPLPSPSFAQAEVKEAGCCARHCCAASTEGVFSSKMSELTEDEKWEVCRDPTLSPRPAQPSSQFETNLPQIIEDSNLFSFWFSAARA